MCRFLLILLLSLLFPMTVHAQCAMPNGQPDAEMGVIVFNKAHKVMQYCNGDDWIGIWGGDGQSETHWLKNGSNIYYNGNVGIGTSDPQSLLDVAGHIRSRTLRLNESIPTNGGHHLFMDRRATAEQVFLGWGQQGAQLFTMGVASNANYLHLYNTGVAANFVMNVGNVGIGTTDPQALLHVNGEARLNSLKGGTTNNFHIDTVTPTGGVYLNWYSTGNVFARNTLLASSDIRLKENIRPISGALNALGSIEGVYFDWKDKERKGRQIGLIAQDVEKVFPEIVAEDQDGFKTISYAALVAPIINAVRELKAENDVLKSRIEKLEDAPPAP